MLVMTAFFIVWTVVACVFTLMRLVHWKSNEVKGVVHGRIPQIPEKNIKPYNHAAAMMFWTFSALFELLGLPLLFLEQNDPGYVITTIGTMLLVILLCVAYSRIEKRYQ